MRRHLIALLFPVSCALQTPPVQPPADIGGTCESAWATAKRLGGCGAVAAGWVERCHDAERAEAELGLRLPVGCMTSSATCAEWSACR